ncbi:MAG: ATP-binding protein [Candidatus Kaiserbacteria bacterium]|nr:ATP-binding protein [Candidatus Kaiserbacteria bacterium]
MNQDLMVRLFRSIEGDSDDDLVKVAKKIIENEKVKGHAKLAGRLRGILDTNVASHLSFKKELKTLLPIGTFIPTDKRHNIPLAVVIDNDKLRHEMILPKPVEATFQSIEKEYVARERLAHFGLKPRQKILLYGAPGCGKSMGAERIAWNIGLPFLKVRFEAIVSSYLGESASNLKSLFESIKHYPCVLLLDEFDFIAKARSSGQDVGEMHRMVNILLNLLEDYDAPGLLIATTNLEGTLDKALFRRFDDIMEIPKPGEEEIARLLKNTLSSISTSSEIDWWDLAKKMAGFSAALVVRVANNAARTAVIQNSKVIGENHLLKALEEVIDYSK